MARLFRKREEGSQSIEAVLLIPVVVLLLVFAIAAGRYGLAQQSVQNAANSAARDASLARSSFNAETQARSGAEASMTSQGVDCASMGVAIDASGINAPLGSVGTVRSTISCTIDLSDIAFPGLPGTLHIERTATSPVDPYRERQ